ncbi:PREDICTED: uncharacterized protein LOC109222191 [Nicotiana attenuata]|uniref:uncharacterized protein LOC109222191 n=1 Tax=Nicotiana attenuata TaxID=49451 RepID=UPI000904FCC1|nr:PREDICTED: uncharacterized protein LOC109222191 [Nicotiana attenuata]
MSQDIKALEDNATWEIVGLPAGKKAIGSKWVFKIKYMANGEVERYKARLVVKGYAQQEGLDYHETFSPIAKMVTVRTVISITASRGWNLFQMDVNNTFLQEDLYEDVYMELPQGFQRQGDYKVRINGDETLEDIGSYHKLIGKLLYLTITRPNLSFAVQVLSQFMQHPKQSHWDTALRVVRYVKGAPSLGILLGTGPIDTLFAYCDSDWASCPNTRRSVIGYIIKLGDSLLSWKSKKQQTVSRSSAEA